MKIASRGATMAVDWEQRIDFARLRSDRLEKARASLRDSSLGAVLLFDQNNIRYVTSTHIGEWARDKSARCVLLPREGDPVLWDFGSAAKHHQLYAPWLPESSWQAGVTSMRGAMPRETGVPDALAARIHRELAERGLAGEPLGIDLTDMETLYSLHRQGIETADAQPVMMRARAIKTAEEIALLEHAAAIVDAVYEEIYRMLRPGVREHEIVARAMQRLFELGSEQVEAINAVSGDRCNPHPHVFSRPAPAPRRPGVLRHHPLVHGLPDVLLPHVQRRRRHALPDRRVQAVPGVARQLRSSSFAPAPRPTRSRRLADGAGARLPRRAGLLRPAVRPRPRRRPVRGADDLAVHSLDHPIEIEEGMVFALETYCAGERRRVGSPDRGGGRRHGDRLPGHHEVPRRGAARLRQDLRARRRPAGARGVDCLSEEGSRWDVSRTAS